MNAERRKWIEDDMLRCLIQGYETGIDPTFDFSGEDGAVRRLFLDKLIAEGSAVEYSKN